MISVSLLLAYLGGAATLDFRNSVIVIPAGASVPEKKTAAMLAEEIEKRTQLRLKVQSEPAQGPAFVIGRTGQMKAADNERDRLAKIDEIINWTNPGPGGFYDDLGNPRQQEHLVTGEGFDRDPEFRHSALIGFGRRPDLGWRLSWFTGAELRFYAPLRMRYTNLDRTAWYKIRVIYGGDMPRVAIRLVANGGIEIHPYRQKPFPVVPVEFEVSREATRGGTLELQWTRPPGLGGNGGEKGR